MSGEERSGSASRIGRIVRIAVAGIGFGVSRLRGDGDGASAEEAEAALGDLRGLAAKIGQATGYLDGLVPDGQRAAYAHFLRSLQRTMDSPSDAEVRTFIETQLGRATDELFAEWLPEPMVRASLAQVHRARLPDGRAVAVKVQYPGVAESVESDLATAALLKAIGGFSRARRSYLDQVLRDLGELLRAELDYHREADHHDLFAELHAGDPTIRVPRVVRSHSGREVLTTELADGLTLAEACAAPADDRRAWVETVWRFVFKTQIAGGVFNTDAYPGNFVFHPGGGVTFLDFGCVLRMAEDRRRAATDLHRAALVGDGEMFERNAIVMARPTSDRHRELALEFFDLLFQPVFSSPFRVTPAYNKDLVDRVKAIQKEVRPWRMTDSEGPAAELLMMNRLLFGLFHLVSRLDVDVDYAAVERQFVPAAPPA